MVNKLRSESDDHYKHMIIQVQQDQYYQLFLYEYIHLDSTCNKCCDQID